MEIIILLIIVLTIYSIKKTPTSKNRPIITKGSYESHLDFLEMNGAISLEEREALRNFEEDIKKTPHKYKTYTAKEFFKN